MPTPTDLLKEPSSNTDNYHTEADFPVGARTLSANAGDLKDVGSVPGSERSPGEGHINLLQNFCLANPMDRGA